MFFNAKALSEKCTPSRRQSLLCSAKIASIFFSATFIPQWVKAQDSDCPCADEKPTKTTTRKNQAAFASRSVKDALKALGIKEFIESTEVVLDSPELAENNAFIPLRIWTELPGVKDMVLLVEKNPAVLVALFHVSDSLEPDFTTRTKIAETSDVYAVALTQDGKAFYSKKEVQATAGGCVG